jgi:hypothetical protein
MAHLIQPITIAGSLCWNSCQLGRSTPAYYTSVDPDIGFGEAADISTPCGPWVIIPDITISLDGEFSFGVLCGDTLDVLFTISSSLDSSLILRGYIDGVLNQVIYAAGNSPQTMTFNLTDSPCGSVITLVCLVNALSYPGTVTAEITSIT